ncbi:hypothetical protein DPMN_147026 [Dreissena polymorpha]|uniref:Uncharacterized protein n=1 Tax=Dreissena polymorpha TaxID=45954 RepID=A0A9D4F879_DREPO|nr:hypothetical protein DPMN_147026 [Dreissena polymorpha]
MPGNLDRTLDNLVRIPDSPLRIQDSPLLIQDNQAATRPSTHLRNASAGARVYSLYREAIVPCH